MFSLIKSWIMKSKAAKVGAGALSGGSILALIFYLNTAVNARVDKQTVKVDKQVIELQKYTREYVQLAIEPIKTEITNLKKVQDDTKKLVRDIHNYLLKTK